MSADIVKPGPATDKNIRNQVQAMFRKVQVLYEWQLNLHLELGQIILWPKVPEYMPWWPSGSFNSGVFAERWRQLTFLASKEFRGSIPGYKVNFLILLCRVKLTELDRNKLVITTRPLAGKSPSRSRCKNWHQRI